MLTWSGFLANLISFIATKLLGRTIDTALDKRSRSAKAFYSLYNSLNEVDVVTRKVVDVLRNAEERKKPPIFAQEIIELAPRIQEVSNQFMQSLDSVIWALEIIDPKLAYLLADVVSGKGAHLHSLHLFLLLDGKAEFVIDFKAARNLEKIRYSLPAEILLHLKLDDLYESVPDNVKALIPDQKILAHLKFADLVRKNVVHKVISPRDYVKIAELREDLTSHYSNIAKAKEALRSFMSRAFTIDDLLFLE